MMTLVAVTTVAAFEAVGSILVIALLIVPAAAAHLLTDRLSVMLVLSLLIGAASAALGHVAAITVPTWFGYADTSTAGMIAVTAGALFAVAMFAAPRHGVVSKLIHQMLLSLRIIQEDVLGLLYRLEEMKRAPERALVPALLRRAAGTRPMLSRLAVLRLRRNGKVALAGASYELTQNGPTQAILRIKTHPPPGNLPVVVTAAMRLQTSSELVCRMKQAMSPTP